MKAAGDSRIVLLCPFLFALYPVIFVYSRTPNEVTFLDLLRPTAVLICITCVLFLLAFALMRNAYKAAIVISILFLISVVYPPVYEHVLRGLKIFAFDIGRHRITLPLAAIVFLLVVLITVRTRRNVKTAARYMFVFGIILIAMSAITIARNYITSDKSSGDNRWSSSVQVFCDKTVLHSQKPLRDIYYIILDGYSREDILKKYFHYDNSAFIGYLCDKGFYVAPSAKSNYTCTTYQALSSSLNFEYLEPLVESVGAKTLQPRLLENMIEDNRTCLLLKRAGYKFVFFPSGFQMTYRNRNADLYNSPDWLNVSEFERALIRNSVLHAFDSTTVVHQKRVIKTFEKLGLVPQIKEPTFTFLHIVCPHPPYVFDRKGKVPPQPFMWKMSEGYREQTMQKLYIDQIDYLNKMVKKTVDSILAESTLPPIIIIQSDHGSRAVAKGDERREAERREQREGILNAYYLPDGGAEKLYPSISPVNSFRTVLNYYFGTKFRILEDRTSNKKLNISEMDET